MNRITTPQDTPSFWLLFNYPFRIFFVSLGCLATLLIPVWVAVVTGSLRLPLALPGVFWHQHEMLFGFLPAAIAGFLLTAVCVWTDTPRMQGARLMLLWLVWLAGRIMLATGARLPEALVEGVNLAFMPLVMLDAGWRIWKARQRRQVLILVVLGLFWVMQIGFVSTFNPAFISGALIMAMALSALIGGRITPAFSASWLRQQGQDGDLVRTSSWLDLATVIGLIVLLATVFFGAPWLRVAVALVAAMLMLLRLIGWRGWMTASNPLLWILHVSLLWIPVALVLYAGSLMWQWPSSAWSHAAGVGVIASLILGVISRVSLGHTGRPLTLPRGMVAAFIAIQLAAIDRLLTAFGVVDWSIGIVVSSVLWVAAFALFLFRYGRILASPRADGRDG